MHCVCVVRSRSCRLPARNEKERKKKKREREGGKSDERRGSRQPFPLSPSLPPVGRGGSRGGEGVCARVLAEEERRRDAANAWTRAACSRVYRVANHSRHPRPITYWFFTYDLIHYHSVIYICPARCGFRGFRGFREQGVGERCEGWGEEGEKKRKK